MTVLKRLLNFIWANNKQLLFYSLLIAILGLLLRFPVPYFTKIIIDEVIPEANRSLLQLLVILTLVLSLFSVGLSYINLLLGLFLNNRIGRSIANAFYNHIFLLPFNFYDKWRTGDILSRAGDARSSVMSLTSTITSTVISIIQLLIFPAVLFYISWELTLLALLVYPLDAWLCIKINRKLFERSTVAAEARADYSSRSFEFVTSMKQIQALNIEAKALREVGHLVERSIETSINRDRIRIIGSTISGVIQGIGTFILLWLGWHWVIDGHLTIGDLIAFSAYAAFLHGPLTSMFELSRQLQNVIVSGKRYFEVADIPEIQVNDNGQKIISSESLQPICLHNVSFSYDGAPDVLKNLNLEIPAHSITAIIGKNGSGKTTLVSLIPRFYEPKQGHITIGKTDVRDMNLQSLRSHVSFITQNSILFRGTILEQITFGIDTVDMKLVEKAVRIVGMEDFIRKASDGFETKLGEKGVGISAGQQQRLLLARAFLQEKPIMIFDEATSALDIETEKEIMTVLQEMKSNHTIIIISHRPSAYEMADNIIKLSVD